MPLSRFWRRVVCVFIIACAMVPLTTAEAEAKTRHHVKHHRHVAPVDSGAKYADILVEAKTGRILHATNADSLRHPASLTKMMTLYITFQALDAGRLNLDQRLPVSGNAAAQSPSKLGLHAGQTIRVGDAILGLVTESANDAAVVLAEAMGGNEERFAQLMTRQAHALGMNRTVFYNPSGLPNPDQVTTARDMAVLGEALIYHYPQYYQYFSHASFAYGGVTHHNHNHLMERYDGMDGIKTGYVRASGFNLVASAVRNGTRLVGVVFGGHSTQSRDGQMARLLDQGFGVARVYQAKADGNGAEGDADESYIVLPTKVAAVFTLPTKQLNGNSVMQPSSAPAPALPMTMTDAGVAIPAPKPAADSSWGVQVGAYSDDAVGHQELAGIAQTAAKITGHDNRQTLQKVAAADGTSVYRARLTDMNQRDAAAVCAYMSQHNQSCVVVGTGQ